MDNVGNVVEYEAQDLVPVKSLEPKPAFNIPLPRWGQGIILGVSVTMIVVILVMSFRKRG